MTPLKIHVYPIHIVVDRCAEIPGRWNAHCLEFDVMSWSDSISGALDLVREAIAMVLADDLAHGRDPLERSAAAEDWDAMWARLRLARAGELPAAAEKAPAFVVAETSVRVSHFVPDQPAPTPEFARPVAFMPFAEASA